MPEGDDSPDCFCLRRSSVSRKRASRASSSWFREVTACFLALVSLSQLLVQPDTLGRGILGTYFCSTESRRPFRLPLGLLSIEKASLRAAEKFRATVLQQLFQLGHVASWLQPYDCGRSLGFHDPSMSGMAVWKINRTTEQYWTIRI